jgi:hypothetical protein
LDDGLVVALVAYVFVLVWSSGVLGDWLVIELVAYSCVIV